MARPPRSRGRQTRDQETGQQRAKGSFRPSQGKSRMSLVIFFRMGGLMATASRMWTGVAERTCRTRESWSPRHRKDVFQVASLLTSLSMSGSKVDAGVLWIDRGRQRCLMGNSASVPESVHSTMVNSSVVHRIGGLDHLKKPFQL